MLRAYMAGSYGPVCICFIYLCCTYASVPTVPSQIISVCVLLFNTHICTSIYMCLCTCMHV